VLLEDFDQLVEFDRLKESLTEEDRAILNKLFEKCQAWDELSMIELFTNSIYLAWIDNLEAKHPLLRVASSGKIGLLEEELKELIVSKQSISNEILLLRSRERVTDDLAFNRLNNRVTYRDLLHQVTKKKKIWPLRKVLTDFEDDVFRLLPCWLASPESVSAIFPMKEMFDLVIFDEASQCFAERGIPALFRGKQAVVAGDSQQLKPGEFFQSRWEEEEEQAEPDTEVDSLLELCDRYLPNVQLQGHYRSKSLALIEFSNKHFYGGKLQMLPELAIANSGAPAIEYIKVDGVWENFCNEIEALKVVELIVELSATGPGKNIGVITFNAPQQSLILDLLEVNFARLGKEMPLTLFVKNIENVQGDERDIIIFSVGYAANKKGIASTQFGSLSQQGGENRLNVAVSRAREKVIVVTSLWPEQLMVADTKNEGPKLLKAYLQFSLDVSQGEFEPNVVVEENGRLHLKHKIRDWFADREYAVDCDQLPYCDLTMKKNSQLIGALLTDDNNYVASLSAKSIHALVPGVLESKRWPFLQLYSRNYWQDKDRFFNEIGKFALNNLKE
jgi:superfamily I DNA and/or RNA helicase